MTVRIIVEHHIESGQKIDLSMSVTGIPIAHKPIHRHFKIILYDRAMISVSNTFPDRAIFLIFRLQ